MGKKKSKKEQKPREYIDPRQFIALEEELHQLEEEHGIVHKRKWWVRIGDWIASNAGKREKQLVNRHKYCWMALFGGWFGLHRFYTKQYFLGAVYLLFFWTGIPLGMAMVDIMIALPMKPDEEGRILL